MANQQGFDLSGGVGSLAKLFAHYDRTKLLGKDGEYRYEPYRWLTQRGMDKSYNVSDIDPTRTRLNYNLAAKEQPLPQAEFVERRLSEIYCHKSALRNGVVDWVVTLPDMAQYEGREREFFEASYGFLAERYGRGNVISAYVHMDEAQPHMHFAFVPVAEDPKHEQGFKLSRKAVNTCERFDAKTATTKRDTREYSKQLHEQLDKAVCEAMGFDRAGVVLTEEQRQKRQVKENMDSPRELKEARARLAELEMDVDRLAEERDLARQEAQEAREDLDAAKDELAGVRAAYAGLQERIARLYEAVQVLVRGGGVFHSLRKAMREFAANEFVRNAWEAVRAAGVEYPLGGNDERRFVRTAEKSLNGDIEREGASLDAVMRELSASKRDDGQHRPARGDRDER